MIETPHIPIVFIHQGNSPYLPYSLWQARYSNPESEVFLIGDAYSRHFDALVNHVDRLSYFSRAGAFAERFVNFSSNPHEFELVCLQRWMVLHEFMEAKGIDRCLYLDSDILLYGDATEDARRFQAFGMTIAGISGHSNYIQDRDMLDRFCRWIEAAYDGPEAIEVLKEKYRLFCETRPAGGISDMTFFTEFKEDGEEDVLDISEPIRQKAYDISFNHLIDFEYTMGRKRVEWAADRMPWCFRLSKGKIQMQTFHFQGEAKTYIKQYMSQQSRFLDALVLANRLICLAQRAYRKLARRAG